MKDERAFRKMAQNGNKAVYTTTSVACGWANSILRQKLLSRLKSRNITLSDGRTDGRTDRVTL